MTVQIGQSLAPSAVKRFCGTAWRLVAMLDLLSFGLKGLSELYFDSHVAGTSYIHNLVKNMVIVKLRY